MVPRYGIGWGIDGGIDGGNFSFVLSLLHFLFLRN